MPAGDNCAESLISSIKRQMRRLGSVGGGGTGSSALKSVQAMSSAALLRQYGTQRVLRAMADYREACASGLVGLRPADVLKPSALTWLYKHVAPEQ